MVKKLKKYKVRCSVSVDYGRTLYVYGTDKEDAIQTAKDCLSEDNFWGYGDTIEVNVPKVVFKDKKNTIVMEECFDSETYKHSYVPHNFEVYGVEDTKSWTNLTFDDDLKEDGFLYNYIGCEED